MSFTSTRWFKALILMAFSLFLCSFTLVLGAVPLHAWRQSFGKAHFALGSVALVLIAGALGMNPLAAALAMLAILVFIFNEFDEKGWGVFRSAAYALLGTFGASYLGMKVWLSSTGMTLEQVISKPVNEFLAQLKNANNGTQQMEVPVAEIIAQLPSGMIIVASASLVTALIFEPRARQLLGLPPKDRQQEFLNFRMPDAFIWLAIVGLLAAFMKHDHETIQIVGINVVNVLVFAYFLQGMAVITQFFNKYQVGPLMRAVSYVLLVLQLFVFVSSVGFIDYWLDFRARLSGENKENKDANSKKKMNEKGGLS